MALSDDYDFRSEPTGPKSFTEYSFGAIMVLVAQIGSFLAMTSQIVIMIPVSWLIPIRYSGGELLALILIGLSLLVFIISIFQVFLGYQLHSQGLRENNRIILFNIITIIFEFSMIVILTFSLGLIGLFLNFQVSIVIIILNITSIYFLRIEAVQKEFRHS
ncbi:MAG: hypothetical protein OEV85_14170 [Candidatus Thorarchaeota archaeon]|nr:hypothetical protein [Candidatus Thorarchaeota archaeon]